MKKILLPFLLILIIACNRDKPVLSADNIAPETATFNKEDYNSFKSSVAQHKPLLVSRQHSEASDYLFHLVNDSLYNYWKGTTWAFHGMSRTPGEGSIACGYFVTNTLADLDFKIERIKLAQCISGDMIKALCTDIHSFNGITNFKAYMEKQPDNSVYIVGLDFHTGYIVKESGQSYFLHSNYIEHEGVVKEKIEESPALQKNNFFMVGSLTSNKKLLQEWVTE